jgi:hypothetical protein
MIADGALALNPLVAIGDGAPVVTVDDVGVGAAVVDPTGG